MYGKLGIFVCLFALTFACSKGPSTEMVKEVGGVVASSKAKLAGFEQLKTNAAGLNDSFQKELSDSLGPALMKKLETTDSLKKEVESMANQLKSQNEELNNVLQAYNTLQTEVKNWSDSLSKSSQSEDEIRMDWDSKKQMLKENEETIAAYENSLKDATNVYRATIVNIREKLKGKK